MSTIIEDAQNRTLLTAIQMITPTAWMALVAIIIGLDPDPLVHRIAFLAAFAVALTGTASLGAYVLSFRLFASKRYRGNLHRSIQHGVVTGLVLVIAALLQLSRAISPLSVAVLVILFLLLQIVVLLRR